jgi:transposase
MSSPLLPDLLPRLLDTYRLAVTQDGVLTPRRPWAPLTDAEWEHIAPYLAALNCGLSFTRRAGRPPEDTRARLDAIFRAVTLKHSKGGRGTWAQLPEGFGKPDTVSRTFRRWAHAKLWLRLLAEVACPTCPPVLKGLTYFICCAFRRGIRLMGLPAILLARRLRLHSALPAPSILLPDPDLSESLLRAAPGLLRPAGRGPWRAIAGLLRLAAGRRVQRWMEPA